MHVAMKETRSMLLKSKTNSIYVKKPKKTQQYKKILVLGFYISQIKQEKENVHDSLSNQCFASTSDKEFVHGQFDNKRQRKSSAATILKNRKHHPNL